MLGAQLLHYRVLEKIGEGAMGVVYLARDTHLERLVALKILPDAWELDTDRLLRFKREARIASALNHPHIITRYEIAN